MADGDAASVVDKAPIFDADDLLAPDAAYPIKVHLRSPALVVGKLNGEGYMPRRGVTSAWSIELDEAFRSRVVDGDLQLVSPGPPVRTIWIAVWEPPPDRPPAHVLDEILKAVHPSPHRRFRERGADADELRYASWYPESDDGRQQWGLYAYTVRSGSYVQVAFLTDDPADLDWALATWRSLQFQPST